MKIIPIIGIALATAISSTALAVEITKGKLISHQEWSTGKVKASYNKGSKTLSSMKQKTTLDGPLPSSTYSETNPVFANAGESVSMINNGFVYIHNTTNEVQKFHYSMYICVNKTSDILECVFKSNFVQLQPDGRLTDSYVPTLTTSFDEAGTYATTATTIFYGGVNGKSTFESESQSNATVVVS